MKQNNKTQLHICLKCLLHNKINKIIDRVARIQDNTYPGSYDRIFRVTKTFYLDLLMKGQDKHIKSIFGPFDR